ncbi:Peptidoglycan-binding (PGRP) domain of peptidoglycan hydrolases-containing protein [Streptomyces sp. DvalAA-19]|nr:Peptidoglycan-binding (PGRP) domain of peptidoglycan hydrolases-containing protein [Streptomyces sp. DvalAA-19]
MRRLPALLATVLAAVLATLLSAPAAQAASWPVVGSGSTGANVTTIQHLLTARNHATAADGIFGSGTADKVKGFQRSQSLTADGVVGPDTWSKLIVTVSSGSNGSAVKAAQVQLNRYGHGLAVDGAFGSGTASAAKKFQQSKGLSADGIVGPDTWRALVSGSGSGGGGGGGSTKLTHAQVSSMFSGAGITWTSTGNCSNRNVSTCTSFEQMRRTTAEGTVALRRASGCAILVTGGTETGHANGTYSHWNGYKVDFSPQSCISNYITRTFTRIGDRGDGAAQYKSASGNIYAREGSHWDVTFHN